jgi:arylsulfatase
MKKYVTVGLAAVLVLIGFLSIATRRSAGAPQLPPYNIILITPDQLRADSMHTYGYDLPDTPNIDKLASQGTLFLRAYSAGSWTTPSFGAVHTGLYPTVHGMGLPPYLSCGNSITRPMVQGDLNIPAIVNLSPNKPVLAELLKGYGMTTAVDNANCWSLFDVLKRGWDSVGFFPGWELRLPDHPNTEDPIYFTAPKTLDWAQNWLAGHKDQRFFLWVHFMEPHSPYNFPKEYDRFHSPDDFPDLNEDTPEGVEKLRSLSQLGNYHAIRREMLLYANKILYVDDYVGRLLKSIHDQGLDDNTIVILTSDHGELLYSHPEDYNTTDHYSLYDTDAHIPLIVRAPGVAAGRTVNTLVSHYDLLPTILDLENLPPQHVDGKSVKPALAGNSTAQVHEYLFGEQLDVVPEFSVRDERYKLIETLPEGTVRVFDHLVDPGETHDISTEIPEVTARLKKALSLHIQSDIQEAKAYPDWKDNLALAVLEQRDSEGLEVLAPREEVITPASSEFQLNGRNLWRLSTDTENCGGRCYWAPPGRGAAFVIWRSEIPLTGQYDIYFKYGGTGESAGALATNASLTVKFRYGSLAYSVDQNLNQGRWNLLGRVDDPAYVKLSDLADGSVIAGAIRLVRVDASVAAPK